MNKFKKYNLIMGVTLASAIAIPLAAGAIQLDFTNGVSEADKERFGKYINDFLTTKSGKPLRLDISEAISVSIDSSEASVREDITKGIRALSNVCPNIRYTIYNNNNNFVPLSNINFIIEDLSGSKAGNTSLNYNAFNAEIQFPITISIDSKFTDAIWGDSKGSVLTTIVEHELMHTLGFSDTSKYGTIMHGSLDMALQTYTSADKEKINYVYGDKKVAYSIRPKECYFIPNMKQEDEETLIN